MVYDQSWLGVGLVGALQAGAISAFAGLLLYAGFHWIGQGRGWGFGPPIGWSFLLALILTAGGDLWDLFYFNYAKLQSPALFRAKLALVHDPANLGVRTLCELAGIALGIYAAWWLCRTPWLRRWFRPR